LRSLFVRSISTTQPHQAADDLRSRVLERADVIEVSGDPICSFNEMPCLIPRARFDIKVRRVASRRY
jgi:hypothetical protein